MEEANNIHDPVFAKFGVEVYTNEYAEQLREENEKLPKGTRIYNIIPSAGFQENVLTCEADVMIIGGARGGGKSYVMELSPLYNIHVPMFTCNGFRKEENDILNGLWNTSKYIYTDVATPSISTLKWTFPSGACVKFEHMQNEKEVDRRFRGTEMPHIIIDELPQISADTYFTLLTSNRSTLGIDSKFIASCNPVGRKNWVYKLISWYIDEDTNEIIPERDSIIRYFFNPGKGISQIIWGDTREEVLEKAKHEIDKTWKTVGKSGIKREKLVSSFCFIQGLYSENKVFASRDDSYISRLLAKGGSSTEKDINGVWVDEEDSASIITAQEYDDMFSNTYQTTGVRTAVADVALKGDDFVIGAFDGNHLFDIEVFSRVTTTQAYGLAKKFLEKNNIREENFLYDGIAIGQCLDKFTRASQFTANSASSDSKIWYNKRAECSEKYATSIREGRISIDKNLQKRKIGLLTLREHLETERPALQRKETNNGKYQMITKADMKAIIGRSPDFTDMMVMHEHFNIVKPKTRKGLWALG